MRVALFLMMHLSAPAVQALLPAVPTFTRASSSTQSLQRLPRRMSAVCVGGEDVSTQKLARNLAGAYLGAFLFGKQVISFHKLFGVSTCIHNEAFFGSNARLSLRCGKCAFARNRDDARLFWERRRSGRKGTLISQLEALLF